MLDAENKIIHELTIGNEQGWIYWEGGGGGGGGGRGAYPPRAGRTGGGGGVTGFQIPYQITISAVIQKK